jgi:hypothetical protein
MFLSLAALNVNMQGEAQVFKSNSGCDDSSSSLGSNIPYPPPPRTKRVWRLSSLASFVPFAYYMAIMVSMFQIQFIMTAPNIQFC